MQKELETNTCTDDALSPWLSPRTGWAPNNRKSFDGDENSRNKLFPRSVNIREAFELFLAMYLKNDISQAWNIVLYTRVYNEQLLSVPSWVHGWHISGIKNVELISRGPQRDSDEPMPLISGHYHYYQWNTYKMIVHSRLKCEHMLKAYRIPQRTWFPQYFTTLLTWNCESQRSKREI